jgi:uncharacterized caspase-like protein
VTAAAPRGRALLTGNAAYQEGRLLNPVNDARAMAEMLRQFDFEVTLVEDANLEKMEAAVGNFSSKPGQSGSVGLFYFSSHGLQIDNQNYLVPVGARLESPADVRHRTLKADWVLGETDGSRAPNIIILNACRNNPYVRPKSTQRLSAHAGTSRLAGRHATAPDARRRQPRRSERYLHQATYSTCPRQDSACLICSRASGQQARQKPTKQVPWIASSITELFSLSDWPAVGYTPHPQRR